MIIKHIEKSLNLAHSLNDNLPHFGEWKDNVRFALYCAENCLSHASDEIQKKYRICIYLIKKWLNDNKSVKPRRLLNSVVYYFTKHESVDVIRNAVYSTVGKVRRHFPSDDDISYHYSSAWFAFHSVFSAVKVEPNKEKEYSSFLKSFKSTIDQKDNFFKSLNFETKTDVLIFFDYLSEHYPDHNVFKDNALNIPEGFEIKGNSIHELAEVVTKSEYAQIYLNRLFRQEYKLYALRQ